MPDAGQARQVEQHLAEARRADPAPVASGAHNAPYPHLSGEHRDLVDQAITHVAAREHYSKETVRNYRNALCQLANDLGARGLAVDLKNHQSLVGHVDAFFPKSRMMKSALNVLHAYHERGYSATAGRPAPADAHVLEQVA
ncbi:Ulp1 family isopeptidase, partial [Bradyrhizobium sp. Arg314]